MPPKQRRSTTDAQRELHERAHRLHGGKQPILLSAPDDEPGRLALEAFPEKVHRFFDWPDPQANWWVSGTVYCIGSRFVLGRLVIEPNAFRDEPPAAGITSPVVRDLKVGDLSRRVLAAVRAEPAMARLLVEAYPGMIEDDQLARAEAGHRRRGRPPEDGLLEQVALEYLKLSEHPTPVTELARIFAERLKKPVPRQTARDWVSRARKRGFLTPGTPGRAGAEPGPRLATRLSEVPETPAKTRRKR